MSWIITTDQRATQATAIATTLNTHAIGAKLKNKWTKKERTADFMRQVAECWGRRIKIVSEYHSQMRDVSVQCGRCGKVQQRNARYIYVGHSFDCECGRIDARKRMTVKRSERIDAIRKKKARLSEIAESCDPVSPCDSMEMTPDQIMSTFGRRRR